MQLNNQIPIFEQVQLYIENEIISEHLLADEKVYSKMQLAEAFKINPITALKALNILVDENILYVKRGVGMFVSMDAKQMILHKRKSKFINDAIPNLLKEASYLDISVNEIISLLDNRKDD